MKTSMGTYECKSQHPFNSPDWWRERMEIAVAGKDAEIAALKERVRLAEEKADELGMEAARQLERVRELEAERNLLKSDLDKVERGYDEVSQRRDETVAMCDYLQNQVKDLENILEQESKMVKAFMSELDKNQDENEFLHGRISELEAKNKRLQSELNKWTRPYDNADLQVMKEQSDSKSLAAQQAYINALDWHYRHEQAENNWLKEALEKYQGFWEDSRMADKMSWEQYDWPIRKKALEEK